MQKYLHCILQNRRINNILFQYVNDNKLFSLSFSTTGIYLFIKIWRNKIRY